MGAEINAESSTMERKRSDAHQNRTPTQHPVLVVAAVSGDGLSNTCQQATANYSVLTDVKSCTYQT